MRLDNAEAMALNAMADHDLIRDGWTFEWMNARRRKGECRWRMVNGRMTKTLRLSTYWTKARTDMEVRNTLLHEIAHALAGHAAGHGAVWKHYARQLGAKPVACTNEPEATKAVSKYAVVCLGEGETLGYVNSTRFRTEGRTCKTHMAKITLLPNKDRMM
jgi:predicted SprT family Zn-dependent metalloprotease